MGSHRLTPEVIQQLSLIVASKITANSNIEEITKDVYDAYMKSTRIFEKMYFEDKRSKGDSFLAVSYY